MKPIWGGGAPLRILMSLSGTADGATPRMTMEALLIEETPYGFFITDGESGSRFIPRARVEDIRFRNVRNTKVTPANTSAAVPAVP